MGNLYSDVRFAVRGLRKAPMVAAIAIVSIALGIGANTAIFTLVDQVLLRLLPVRDPQQLVLLSHRGSHYGNNRGGNALSYPLFRDFRDRNQVFSGVFGRFSLPFHIGFRGQTERVSGELVSGEYFEVLGVKPALGRLITLEEDRTPGAHPVAVLGYSYWKNHMAGDPAIVGKTIVVNNYTMTIIGVSEAGFEGVDIGSVPAVRIPMMMKGQMTPQWNDLDNRRSRWVNVFGRLKPGVNIQQAEASLQPMFHSILEMEVKEPAFRTASAYAREQFLKGKIEALPAAQGRSVLRRQLTNPLWVLMTISGFVLLIACANVASLLLARAASRQKEIAVRLALGAGRGRIMTQLLVESLLLSFLGGLAGLALAFGTAKLLIGLMSRDSSLVTATPDLRVLAFTFAAATLTGILFGLAPALQSTNPNVATTLKDQAGAVIGGGHVWFRKALVTAQVALSLLLLIGAGLFVRSLANLQNLNVGFRTENLLSFSVDPVLNGYTPARAKIFYRQLMDSVRAIPSVNAAGFGAMTLLTGDEWDSSVTVEGYEPKPGEDMNPHCNAVSSEYFRTLEMRLLAGRDFSAREEKEIPIDTEANQLQFSAAIVNEKFARKYFGDRNAVGRHLGLGGDPGTKTTIEIVGVVSDAKYEGVRDETPPQVFFPYMESAFVGSMTAYVRTNLDPELIAGALRSEVRKLDANLPIYALRTVEDQRKRSLLQERLVAGLSAAFGFLATALALVGLYGVMAHTVTRRTREMGIRMALGAVPSHVAWMVMREVLALVGIGVAIALPAAIGLSRFVQSQLYGLTPNDPLTIGVATLLITAVACAAGYFPARRASLIRPIKALRYE